MSMRLVGLVHGAVSRGGIAANVEMLYPWRTSVNAITNFDFLNQQLFCSRDGNDNRHRTRL